MKKIMFLLVITTFFVTSTYASWWWPFGATEPSSTKPLSKEERKKFKETGKKQKSHGFDKNKDQKASEKKSKKFFWQKDESKPLTKAEKKKIKKEEDKRKKEANKLEKKQKREAKKLERRAKRETKKLKKEQPLILQKSALKETQSKGWISKFWQWIFPSKTVTAPIALTALNETSTPATLKTVKQTYTRTPLKTYTIDAKYPYLYKRPAWPFEMLYSKQTDLFQVLFQYDYQKDAFNSSGSSVDVSRLVFGEKSFDFSDILLALKLRKKDFLVDVDTAHEDHATRPDWAMFRDYYFDKKLIFFGKSEEFKISLDFARYIHDRDIMFGVKIPLGYQIHRLKLDSTAAHLYFNPEATTLYQAQIQDVLNWAIEPKHLSYLPKMSLSGIGDIETFLNFQFKTKYVERFVTGIDVIWSTAKDSDIHKLWAPALGDGFTKIELFFATLFGRKNTCLQPHMFLKGTYQCPGHKDKRVPWYLDHTDPYSDLSVLSGVIARGEMVRYTEKLFKEPDTTIPAFADNIKSVKIRPGPEVELLIGNLFEKFIFKKAYLDLFYNFRAKWSDHISNSDLPRDLWNVGALKENTHQIEHKIGADFSYQFDAKTRLQFDFNYVFAGINVPSTIQCALALNTEF